MERLYQGEFHIVQTKKTVDWLVNNTAVRVFNPLTFEGYQRSIDEKHCEKIVAYLMKKFYLPTSIICSSQGDYCDNLPLNIVDGQHRVHAFRILQKRDPARYQSIKDNEVSVIVLENVAEEVEIDTFITINKTSKKVDTSLAFVLKNKINYNRASKDIGISKREYVAVEVANILNSASNNDYRDAFWGNKISFEGTPTKQNVQLISLNAFVKSMRAFLGALEKYSIIELNWTTMTDLDDCLIQIEDLVDFIWHEIRYKWPELFTSDVDARRIIQGSIGFTAINRFLTQALKMEDRHMNLCEFMDRLSIWIRSINVSYSYWLPGGVYSKYSSEAGYSIIAQELIEKSEAGMWLNN